MSVVTSGIITQSPAGNVLTFTDNTTGLVAPITRTLAVYDYNLNLLANPVFTANVATYDITADGWYRFIENITDANGTYSQTIDYESTAFYQNLFATAMAAQTCPNGDYFNVLFNLGVSQDYYQASLRYFIGGFAVQCQQMITQANYYVSTPYYAQ